METKAAAPLSEVEADRKAVIAHAFHGVPLDPDVATRVHARAEAIRRELPLTDVAVELIREGRDDL